MKDNIFFSPFNLVFLYIILALFLYTPPVYANMITTPEQSKLLISYFIIGILILFVVIPTANSFIEAYIATLILGTHSLSKNIVKAFLIINFISYYPALIMVTLLNNLMQKYLHMTVSLLIVEILVVTYEYFLIKWQLNKLYLKSLIPLKATNIQSLKISLIVNVVSLLIGAITVALFSRIPSLF